MAAIRIVLEFDPDDAEALYSVPEREEYVKYAEELNLHVAGGPDLGYQGYRVEVGDGA